jgi:hypothetical protein
MDKDGGCISPILRRRIGLSRCNGPQTSLLSIVGGQQVQNRQPTKPPEPVTLSTMRGGNKALREPEAIDAPPLSSDDDEDDPRRGDIQPTVFSGKENKFSSRPQRSTRRHGREGSQQSETRSTASDKSQSNGPPSSAGLKRPSQEARVDNSSHLHDDVGFVIGSQKSRIRGPRGKAASGMKGYGRSSQPSSQKSASNLSGETIPTVTYHYPIIDTRIWNSGKFPTQEASEDRGQPKPREDRHENKSSL